ncbi:MAG: GNAT family N-acetyltransferase [Chloroflexi bacterium]|nr:GNAT family N-acetyltransferase [Chloroflexota bacterium]
MNESFGPATIAAARQFVRWRYAPPYDIYNMVTDPDDANLVEAAANYFLDPAIGCHALTDEWGRVLAFCTFGEDAQVPGGDYGRIALDIGFGMRPDLTGQGLGREFVTAVIHFAQQTFQPDVLRVTIAAFNRRALRVWTQQGFAPVQEFEGMIAGKRPFIILEKSESGGTMQVEFLGSGGAFTTPRAGCFCPICEQARAKGVPYSRSGPAILVHGPDILIDTSEQINEQLNRARIGHIPACIYSHWHPDHTAGRRIWEMNIDWRHWPRHNRPTDIYLPPQVAADFATQLGLRENFAYMQQMGAVRVHHLTEGEPVHLNGWQITPFPVAEAYVYAFLFEGDGRRVLICPDELFGWQPPTFTQGVDLAVVPMGIVEFNVWTGERIIPADHPVLQSEATFRQTLDMLRQIQPRQAIMTHIEEPDGLGYDDLLRLEAQLQTQGYPLRFAYDTMQVKIED